MATQTAQLDQVFKALADPTRRAIVERLSQGSMATKELAEPFPMALPSFMQHLQVLEDCELVRSRKEGRVRTFTLNVRSLKSAETWMVKQRQFWEQRLNQLDAYLANMEDDDDDQDKP